MSKSKSHSLQKSGIREAISHAAEHATQNPFLHQHNDLYQRASLSQSDDIRNLTERSGNGENTSIMEDNSKHDETRRISEPNSNPPLNPKPRTPTPKANETNTKSNTLNDRTFNLKSEPSHLQSKELEYIAENDTRKSTKVKTSEQYPENKFYRASQSTSTEGTQKWLSQDTSFAATTPSCNKSHQFHATAAEHQLQSFAQDHSSEPFTTLSLHQRDDLLKHASTAQSDDIMHLTDRSVNRENTSIMEDNGKYDEICRIP